MFIYSKTMIKFTRQIKDELKKIIAFELKLKVVRERFYDRSGRVSYPIKAVIFNHRAMLGYFDSNFYEIGIHERLIHTSIQQLQNILRHELAHYMIFIQHGASVEPHGHEFKTFCLSLGWGEEVYRAATCLEDAEPVPEEESPILRKVKKLMALSSSSNPNEAEQAMLKSQQMLLKHQIDVEFIDEEKIILKRVLGRKKQDAKMSAIAAILQTFFVSVVYNRGRDFIYLEIVGLHENVEIAEYVAAFLDRELDKLWETARREVPLKGKVAKNSFLLGISRGYCQKVEALKRDYHEQALMVIEKQLVDIQGMVYPRLSTLRSSRQVCADSSSLGEKMGRSLTIHPAVHNTTKSKLLSLIQSIVT